MTFLVVCTDALDRQQRMIDTSETVGHYEEHGKFEKRGEIGCPQLRCHRGEPSANPLDEEGAPLVGEAGSDGPSGTVAGP